jgi:hypothetical protein
VANCEQPGAGIVVVLLSGSFASCDAGGLCERVRVVLEGCDAQVLVCDLGGLTAPDLGAVEVVARLALTAGRLGRHVRVLHASIVLQELLCLVGLGEVVALGGASGLEPRGQAEQREQVGGVEERGQPDDPAA